MLISILTYHVSVHSLSYWYIFVALSICCNSSETLLWHNFDYHASFNLPIFALTNHRSSRSKFIFICVNFQRNYSAINRVATFTSPQKKINCNCTSWILNLDLLEFSTFELIFDIYQHLSCIVSKKLRNFWRLFSHHHNPNSHNFKVFGNVCNIVSLYNIWNKDLTSVITRLSFEYTWILYYLGQPRSCRRFYSCETWISPLSSSILVVWECSEQRKLKRWFQR